MTTNNIGLDKLGESMSVKKYLYREDQIVFDKIDTYKKTLTDKGVKCSTKDAMTHLILKGFEAEEFEEPKAEVTQVPEPETSLVPVEEPKE